MENVILRGGANRSMLWGFPAALIETKGKKSFGSVFCLSTDPPALQGDVGFSEHGSFSKHRGYLRQSAWLQLG